MMWIVEHSDGAISQHHDEPGTLGVDTGVRYASVERELDLLVERWDFDASEIVPVPEGIAERVDQAHLADHGPDAIRWAHIRKAVEAQVILSGVTLPDSIVAQEALARGLSAETLAALIVEKASAAAELEVSRIVAKLPSS